MAAGPWFVALRRRESFLVFVMLLAGALPGVAMYFLWPSVWGALVWGVLFWPCAFIAGALVLPPKDPR